jgi:hypothetical protein
MADKAQQTLPSVNAIYERLKAGKYTENKPFEYGDADCWAWHYQNGKRQTVSVQTEGGKFLYITEPVPASDKPLLKSDQIFHIRRFWPVFNPGVFVEYGCDEPEDYMPTGADRFAGIRHAILDAEQLLEYSDNLPGNQDITRPDLEWYRQAKFKVQGVQQDPGYVLSFGNYPNNGIVSNALYKIDDIVQSLLQLQGLQKAIQ